MVERERWVFGGCVGEFGSSDCCESEEDRGTVGGDDGRVDPGGDGGAVDRSGKGRRRGIERLRAES